MNDILIGIVGSVVGALVVLVAQEVFSWWRARQGTLTGKWKERIFAEHGQPEKFDLITCRHIGNTLSGQIKRVEPKNEVGKEWHFSGQMRGPLLFLTFWPKDAKKNPGSYGTIQLHMINDSHFKGYYVKLIVAEDKEQFTGQLRQCHLEWRRSS